MVKVLIFGSCVSRDPFNESAVDFEVVDYFARSSFASLSGFVAQTSPIALVTSAHE